MKPLVVGIVITLILAACSDPYNVRQFRSSISPPKHIVYKNYTIDAVQTAFVGAPVVRVKDYYVTRTLFKSYTTPVAISAMMEDEPTINYSVGSKFLVAYTINYGNTRHVVVIPKNPLPDNAGLLLTEDGRYDGVVVTRDEDDGEANVFNACAEDDDICVNPRAISFTPSRIESLGKNPLKSRDFASYEIIYSGATKDTISLLYREYTPDDMARPAYTQNLTYDRASSILRFRNVKIRVLDASNQSLKYAVVADDLARLSAGDTQ